MLPNAFGRSFPLLLLLVFLLFPSSRSFDLTSLLSSLGIDQRPAACPSLCTCSTRRAEALMQDYLSRYLPYMGVHMQPQLEKQARATVTALTTWIGSTADLKCRVPSGQRVNLTELLQASALSFKALRVECEEGATLVWDVSPFDAFINVLDVSGCRVETAAGADSLVVPLNLWVLDLDRVPAEAVRRLDVSTALALLALSITNTQLVSLPEHWSNTHLRRLMVVRLAYDSLSSYECEVRTSELTSLNLDHNNLKDIPSCVLDGSRYANHLSLRHNHVRSPEQLLVNVTEEEPRPTPRLYHLDLAYNQMSGLRAIRKIQPLFGLDLSHNAISKMALDTFTLTPLLQWMDLSYNRLEHVLDGALSDMISMIHLNLSHNRLRSFEFDQSPLSTKLVNLDLRHNRLTYPPFADTGYIAPRLSRILAADNPFRCDCNLRVFSQFLDVLNSSRQQNWFGLGYWDGYEQDPAVSQPFVDTQELTCSTPTFMKGTHLSSLSLLSACPLLKDCPTGCVCQLLKDDAERVSVDCSHSNTLTELPKTIAVIANTPVVLNLSHTNLRRLEHRPYLRLISELHAASSKVSTVTSGAVQALQNVSVLDLQDNLLKSLPSVLHNLTFPAATNISLGGNPWKCGCSDLWMPGWLVKHHHVLNNITNIRCRWMDKEVVQLHSSDLVCDMFSYLPLVIGLSVLLLLSAVVAALLARYKLEVLVFLYTRFRLRPFDMYRYDQTQSSLFDVFVSFSHHDHKWVVETLVDQLENRPNPYKLCIHLRDFPVGAPIADNISWAVDNSRCTLLVLSRGFVASEWCRHEFRLAHARLLKDPNAKLIILLHGPLDARSMERELLAYLRTNTYLRTEDKWFWNKLAYALPSPQGDVVVLAAPQGADEAGAGDRGEGWVWERGWGGPTAPHPLEMNGRFPVEMAGGDDAVALKHNGDLHRAVFSDVAV